MNRLINNRIYKHFKGDYYLLVDIAKDSETLEDVVVYRKLYDDGSLWVRSKDSFLSLVDNNKYPNVTQKYKFELVDVKSKKSI